MAIGAWGWGHLTDYAGVEGALLTASGLMLISPLLGVWLTMPRVGARNEDAEVLADPEVKLSLTARSGPLVVEIEYRVAQENARAFHNIMQDVQLARQRNGAYGWSIERDIGIEPVRIRRMLERPFGAVRWKEETPDRAASEVVPVVATAAGSST